MYFNYTKVDNPVRVGFIGTGDEGGVLIGALTPNYCKSWPSPISAPTTSTARFTAIIQRKRQRSSHGADDQIWLESGRRSPQARESLRRLQRSARRKDKLGIEAVIIALPLHLHAPVAIEAMEAASTCSPKS